MSDSQLMSGGPGGSRLTFFFPLHVNRRNASSDRNTFPRELCGLGDGFGMSGEASTSTSYHFIRPSQRANIEHRREVAQLQRTRGVELRRLRKLQADGVDVDKSGIPEWKRSVQGISAEFQRRKETLAVRAKRAVCRAKELEGRCGSGCTCRANKPYSPIVDILVSHGFPKDVANEVGLYVPPGTPAPRLNRGQADVLGRVLRGANVFFTGPAGTGKSFVLKEIRDFTAQLYGYDQVACTALTGAAGTLIGGQTLHSWAGIGRGLGDKKDLLKKARGRGPRPRWETTRVLIIDEVSMLSAELFEQLDYIGRRIRKNLDAPFGGMQLVFCGDFFQLPAVGSQRMCFQSPVWSQCFQTSNQLRLTHVFRQKDPRLRRVLDEVRHGRLSFETLRLLKTDLKRPLCRHNGVLPTILFATNADVDATNRNFLEKLDGDLHVYHAIDRGEPQALDSLNRSCRAPRVLGLKIGAQVMLTRNLRSFRDLDGKEVSATLHNGSRGVVTGFPLVQSMGGQIEYVQVRFNNAEFQVQPVEFSLDKRVYNIETQKWEIVALATRTQFPLKLAWAITIHKSQGMTIDKLSVSMAGVFGHGVAYVALSRCKSIQSLHVQSFSEAHVRVNPRVGEFYQSLLEAGAAGVSEEQSAMIERLMQEKEDKLEDGSLENFRREEAIVRGQAQGTRQDGMRQVEAPKYLPGKAEEQHTRAQPVTIDLTLSPCPSAAAGAASSSSCKPGEKRARRAKSVETPVRNAERSQRVASPPSQRAAPVLPKKLAGLLDAHGNGDKNVRIASPPSQKAPPAAPESLEEGKGNGDIGARAVETVILPLHSGWRCESCEKYTSESDSRCKTCGAPRWKKSRRRRKKPGRKKKKPGRNKAAAQKRG